MSSAAFHDCVELVHFPFVEVHELMMLLDCFYCMQVRQFMTGIKNYLVKHGEGELEDLIERERSQVCAVIRVV